MDKGLTITCPHCKRTFPLDDAIIQTIRSDVRTSVEEELEALKKKEIDAVRLEEANKARASYEQQAVAIKEQAEKALADAKAAKANEKAALEARIKLEKEKEDLELTYMRKYQEDLAKARIEVMAKQDLVLKQKEQTIDGLKKQIEELQRKAELGSQQAQGEALEATLQERLERLFPMDAVEPVPTGTRGADVLQRVNARMGRCCGTIIWESKETKAWAGDWIAKLKKNQRDAGAELAVIASTALPEGVEGFQLMDGVWVTSWPLAMQLASALRFALMELDRTKMSMENQSGKMEMLYGYLVSPQFRNRIQDIVEAFAEMDNEIEKEKRAMARIWTRRSKLIERVKYGTITMYGELEGIMGSEIPALPALEMPYSLDAGDDELDAE